MLQDQSLARDFKLECPIEDIVSGQKIRIVPGSHIWFRHAGNLWRGETLKVGRSSISVILHGKMWRVAWQNVEYVEDSGMWLTKYNQ